MTALACLQTEFSGVQPAATSGAHWSTGAPLLQVIVLVYSQQSRYTETPSITLVAGPSEQTAAVLTVQRPPAASAGHWSSQRSVAVTAVVGRV